MSVQTGVGTYVFLWKHCSSLSECTITNSKGQPKNLKQLWTRAKFSDSEVHEVRNVTDQTAASAFI